MDKRELILDTVDDLVATFLYYDRKEDDDLRRGDIEAAVRDGDIYAETIVMRFRDQLLRHLGIAQ